MEKLLVIALALFSLKKETLGQDPCQEGNHHLFPQNGLGSRNEKCEAKVTSACDYYLTANWYVVPDAIMLDRCPTSGSCGVSYPVWLDGAYPSVADGLVNMSACAKRNNDCCFLNVTVILKNCTYFIAYFLPALPSCPMTYCFESDLPCEPPTTTEETTPSSAATTTREYSTTSSSAKTATTSYNAGGRTTHDITMIVGLVVAVVFSVAGALLVGYLIGSKRLCRRNPPALNPFYVTHKIAPEEHEYTSIEKVKY